MRKRLQIFLPTLTPLEFILKLHYRRAEVLARKNGFLIRLAGARHTHAARATRNLLRKLGVGVK